MGFLKFNNKKDVVAINKKRLKSLNYNGRVYNFDIDKGDDVNIHIQNPLNETDVECYKIPNDIIYDKVECTEDTFINYYSTVKGFAMDSLPLYDDSTAAYGLFVNAILTTYISFKNQNGLSSILTTGGLIKFNKNQSQLYLMPESFKSETWKEDDAQPCAFEFYNLRSYHLFNLLNSQGENMEEPINIWETYKEGLANAYPDLTFPTITDHASYLKFFDENLEPYVLKKTKEAKTDDDVEAITNLLQMFGLAPKLYNEVIAEMALRNDPSLENKSPSTQQKLEAAQKNCDDLFDYIYSCCGLEIVNLTDIQPILNEIDEQDQSTNIIVQDLMNNENSLKARYYYSKSFDPITVFVTKHISENLISSDIFFPQKLDTDNEKLNIKHLKIDVSNLFDLPINSDEYTYISRHPLLKIAYIQDARKKQTHEYIYREVAYGSMKATQELDIPEGCTDIDIVFATSDYYDDAYWVENLGTVMFEKDDTEHLLPNNTPVVSWPGYYSLQVHNEYTELKYGWTFQNDDESEGYVVDRNYTKINGYTRCYFKADYEVDVAKRDIKLLECLAGDTLITMSDLSQKRLDQIKVGDEVITLKKGKKIISKVIYSDSDQVKRGFAIRYVFQSGTDYKYIDVIKNHRFFNGKKCKHINDMETGEKILDENGKEYTLVEARALSEMRHFTIFTENASPYIANGFITGNIFCNIKPGFLAKFIQRIYLALIKYFERKHK